MSLLTASKILTTECSFTDHLKHKFVNKSNLQNDTGKSSTTEAH